MRMTLPTVVLSAFIVADSAECLAQKPDPLNIDSILVPEIRHNSAVAEPPKEVPISELPQGVQQAMQKLMDIYKEKKFADMLDLALPKALALSGGRAQLTLYFEKLATTVHSASIAFHNSALLYSSPANDYILVPTVVDITAEHETHLEGSFLFVKAHTSTTWYCVDCMQLAPSSPQGNYARANLLPDLPASFAIPPFSVTVH